MSAPGRPYLLRSLHKSAQRLVLLAACASAGSPSKARSAQRVAAIYGEPLFELVAVPAPDLDRVLSYVGRRALVREYGERLKLKGKPSLGALRAHMVEGHRVVLREDWLLSDPTLLACTGREQRESLVRTVAACQELNLLHPTTCVLQSYGSLLTTIAREDGMLQGLSGDGPNPFRPNLPYAIAAFFQVARSDWRMLSRLLPLVRLDSPTSFTHICGEGADIIRSVAATVPRNVTTRQVHAWLERQASSATRLKVRVDAAEASAKGGSFVQTLYRPLEDLFLSRLEILTDVGALDKADSCWRYTYRRSDSTASLLSVLTAGDDGLERRYFEAIARLHGRTPLAMTGSLDILTHLRGGHARFQARNGYAPILESVVYANVRSWSESGHEWRFVEVEQAIQALRLLAGASSPPVRLMADRFRRPFTFALDGAA